MSASRIEYFVDLVDDAVYATRDLDPEIKPQAIAALIQSDAMNGLRKALLDVAEAVRRTGGAA